MRQACCRTVTLQCFLGHQRLGQRAQSLARSLKGVGLWLDFCFFKSKGRRCSASSLQCSAFVSWRPLCLSTGSTRLPERQLEDDLEDLEFFRFKNVWALKKHRTKVDIRRSLTCDWICSAARPLILILHSWTSPAKGNLWTRWILSADWVKEQNTVVHPLRGALLARKLPAQAHCAERQLPAMETWFDREILRWDSVKFHLLWCPCTSYRLSWLEKIPWTYKRRRSLDAKTTSAKIFQDDKLSYFHPTLWSWFLQVSNLFIDKGCAIFLRKITHLCCYVSSGSTYSLRTKSPKWRFRNHTWHFAIRKLKPGSRMGSQIG